MTGIYPKPVIDFIPKIFRNDKLAIKLADKLESIICELEADIRQKENHNRADEIIAGLLDEIGFILSAGLKNQDTELAKRRKIRDAVPGHKNRSTFDKGLKPLLDTLTGFDSVILDFKFNGQWVVTGDGNTPTSAFWSVVGGDGVNDDFGIFIGGGLLDQGVAGIIFINLHDGITTAQFTESEILAIVDEVEGEQDTAFFVIILGYIDGAGEFVTYDGGIIQ